MNEKGDLPDNELARIDQAIAAQERLRGVLPDEQIETMLAALHEKRAALLAQVQGSGAVAQGGSVAAGAGGVAARHIGGDVTTGGRHTGIDQREQQVQHQTNVAGNYVDQRRTADGDDPAALREAYLRHVLQKAGHLALAGVDPHMASDAQARLELNAVYTALLTLTAEEALPDGGPGRRAALAAEGGREMRRLSALAQLDRQQRLVLLGDPGSGKSTFVSFVALCMAGEGLGHPQANLASLTEPLPAEEDGPQRERDKPQPQPWTHGALLPVRVVLRDLAARGLPAVGARAGARHMCEFIAAELAEAALGGFEPFLRQELRDRGGLLLLDGLDEVPEASGRRDQIRQMVAGVVEAFPRCRVLVTSRTYAYQQQDWKLPGFHEAVLAPFGAGQIARFVERWYAHVGQVRGLHAADARGRAERLQRAIAGSERLRELAGRPLLLTLMASLHAWRGGSLPQRREELYADTVDLLLDWWENQRVVRGADGQVVVIQPSLAEWLRVDRERVRALLGELAFQAHGAQPELTGTADLAQGELLAGLMRISRNPEANPVRLVEYLRDRAGLLVERGVGVYTFPHRTFQEYLAACHLTADEYPEQVAELARAAPERWREVALLAGAKAARGTAAAIWSLADALCFQAPANDALQEPADAWGALLAGQALAESADLRAVSPRNRLKLACVRAGLVRVLEEGRLPAIERARAGDALAALGDPRPGVGVRILHLPGEADVKVPDIAWCEVPGGSFVMGSQDDSLSLGKSETPQRRPDAAAFRVGRFPVTQAQYAAFVDDGGYTARRRACWTEAGWARKEAAGWSGPWRSGGAFDLSNHPVIGISWYEAVAFCRWLEGRLREAGLLAAGWTIGLPSETQWEKAARGADGRVYPWGNEADPERANYGDTGIGATSAVGCFPGGASPYGVLDMSGNVWEWCATRWQNSYKEYRDDNEPEGEVRRVLRGGAFNGSSRNVRCAFRDGDLPRVRGWGYGFRVVASPVSL